MVSKPYGGKLVNRVLSESERAKIFKDISERPQIQIDKSTAFDVDKIAIGAFSPLEGFMGKEDFNFVLHEESLSNGLPWTIPIILTPDPESVKDLKEGDEPVLVYDGKPLAILHLDEKFTFDKDEYAKSIFKTTDLTHPDVKKLNAAGNVALAGKISLIERFSSPGELTPQETRDEFEKRGWETITAFQTRNPPHVAHEYIQRCALELVDGLLIHPVVGELKADDFPPEALLESYGHMVENYYPDNRALLSPLSIAMRYAGPKAAIFLAIIRKNYGCTHFIVGRDMAGIGNYYDSHGAHKLFKKLNLGIEPMAFKEAYPCKLCGSMVTEKTCRHGSDNSQRVSMTQIRKMLVNDTRPPEEIMRPDIADLLMKYKPSLNGTGK